jgi:hypothetical protein
MLRETQVVRHGLTIFCAGRIILGLCASSPSKSAETKRDRYARGHDFSS